MIEKYFQIYEKIKVYICTSIKTSKGIYFGLHLLVTTLRWTRKEESNKEK